MTTINDRTGASDAEFQAEVLDRFGETAPEQGQEQGQDQIAAQAGQAHHGLTVLELGEDGGTLVALGHHDDRRTLAAFAHYARTVWENRLDGIWGPEAPTSDQVQRVKAIVTHACHRGWLAPDGTPAADLERADPSKPCDDCTEEADSDWAMLYSPRAQDQPDAFPVTVWEYDQ